jgi:hypothetical protein
MSAALPNPPSALPLKPFSKIASADNSAAAHLSNRRSTSRSAKFPKVLWVNPGVRTSVGYSDKPNFEQRIKRIKPGSAAIHGWVRTVTPHTRQCVF